MFTKLLKYEWKATRGVLGLLCLICLGAALLGGGAMRYLVWMSQEQEEMSLGILLCILALVGAILSMAVCGAAALFLQVARFYKSRFTDEGYLTFTLPVTTHQILLSSLVNTAIGMVIAFAAILICMAGMLLLGFSGMDLFWETFRTDIARAFLLLPEMLGGRSVGYLALMLLDFLTGFACELIVLMLAVTIGALIARKHKILAAVGVYYGIHVVLSVFSSVFMVGTALAEELEQISLALPLGASAVFSLAIAAGGYFLMYYLTDRKLNLS